VLGGLDESPELITVYRGAGVDADGAQSLLESLQRSHPDTEFELHEGGQEHYPYILSLE
jgi:dihydroxyacetone kinase-like predicted kinase